MRDLPRDFSTIYGHESDQALWFSLSAQTAAALHWPRAIPVGIAQALMALAKASQQQAALAGLVGALLAVEEVEGVATPISELAIDAGEEEEEGGWENTEESDAG